MDDEGRRSLSALQQSAPDGLRWGGTHKIPKPEVEFFDFGTFWRDQRGIVRLIADHLDCVWRWSCQQYNILPEQLTRPLRIGSRISAKPSGSERINFMSLSPLAKLRPLLLEAAG